MECVEATLLEKVERNRLYLQRHRKKCALQHKGADIFTTDTVPDEIDTISTQDASRVAQKIIHCIFDKLHVLPGHLNWQKILKKVLRYN